MTEKLLKELIIKSVKKVKESGLIKKDFQLNDDTVLLGMWGVMDSIAFVTFVTDLEESIEEETGREFVVRLQEIHDLNQGKTALIVKDMARLLAKLMEKKSSDEK